MGSWQGCVVCWSGKRGAAPLGRLGGAPAAWQGPAGPAGPGAPTFCVCSCRSVARPQPHHRALPSLPQTMTRRACCPATPATASTTRTAWSRRWRSRRCRRCGGWRRGGQRPAQQGEGQQLWLGRAPVLRPPARMLCQAPSATTRPPRSAFLPPPPPQEPFLCPRCQRLSPGAASGGKPLTVEFARASGGQGAWRLAQLLAARDYRCVGGGGGGWERGNRLPCRCRRLLLAVPATWVGWRLP